MNIIFDLNGRNRKDLVNAISEITGTQSVYKFMPTAAFEIGCYTVTREGTLECGDGLDSRKVKQLLKNLAEKGFVAVTDPKNSESSGTENSLTVSMPRDFFDDTVFGKLDRLIESKSDLFKLAFETESLDYTVTDTEVQFPWFTDDESETSSNAYCEFISAFCKMAKEQKRINRSQAQTDNPKFAMRVFLLRLGFVGDEYKATRKVLLRNLKGSAAYRRREKANEISN